MVGVWLPESALPGVMPGVAVGVGERPAPAASIVGMGLWLYPRTLWGVAVLETARELLLIPHFVIGGGAAGIWHGAGLTSRLGGVRERTEA